MITDSALVIVDMLYDFIDGSLACRNSAGAVEKTLAFLNEMTGGRGNDQDEIQGGYPVLFVCDHHPSDHCSFSANGGQWPVHCVAGTRGGEVHDSLKPYMDEELTFYKGCDRNREQYSGFEGISQAGQSLGEVLEILDIKDVYVCGIATEFCVKETSTDLHKAGYRVHVLSEALAYVEHEGHLKALAEMKSSGIEIL